MVHTNQTTESSIFNSLSDVFLLEEEEAVDFEL